MDGYRINYLHRLITEDNKVTESMAFTNFFIVEFPEKFNLRPYDVVSVEFTDDNVCKIKIRNNFDNYPLFMINEYVNKNKCLFRRCKDSIKVNYINRIGEVKCVSTLTDIVIKNVHEDALTYCEGNVQTITMDIKYKKRVIEKF